MADNAEILAEADRKYRLKAAIFFTSVAGLSAMVGFGTTLAAVKKQDSKHFNKGLTGTIEMADSGAHLALRALGWGTVFAFGGCGLISYTIWKVSGAKDLKDFRQKMGEVLPRLTSTEPPKSRTEFKSLGDLMNYLNTDYGKSKPKD